MFSSAFCLSVWSNWFVLGRFRVRILGTTPAVLIFSWCLVPAGVCCGTCLEWGLTDCGLPHPLQVTVRYRTGIRLCRPIVSCWQNQDNLIAFPFGDRESGGNDTHCVWLTDKHCAFVCLSIWHFNDTKYTTGRCQVRFCSPDLYVKIQFVPRSKHTPSLLYKPVS